MSNEEGEPMAMEDVLGTLKDMDQLNKVIARVAVLHSPKFADPWSPEEGQVASWSYDKEKGEDLIDLTWVEDGYPPETHGAQFPLSLLWSDVAASEAHKARLELDAEIIKQKGEVRSREHSLKRAREVKADADAIADQQVQRAEAELVVALEKLQALGEPS